MRILILGLALLTFSVAAKQQTYGVLSASYSDMDFSQNSQEGAGYRVSFGYELTSQWYLEFGYQKLMDTELLTAPPTTLAQFEQVDAGMQGDAISIAFLGKASGQLGELFYRVGLLNVDVKGQDLLQAETCELGQATEFTVDNQAGYRLCDYDEGSVAGSLGIGFDFYIGTQAFLRTEIEYIKGQNGLTSSVAHIGVRYNF